MSEQEKSDADKEAQQKKADDDWEKRYQHMMAQSIAQSGYNSYENTGQVLMQYDAIDRTKALTNKTADAFTQYGPRDWKGYGPGAKPDEILAASVPSPTTYPNPLRGQEGRPGIIG